MKELFRLESPVFVVGCCNSGTTLLWQTLLGHPAFSGPTVEGQDLEGIPTCMKHFLGKDTFRMFAHPRFESAYHLTEKGFNKDSADRLISEYAKHHINGSRFIEKSPANSMRTRFLQRVFPDASFVIIIRNGYAVAEGIRRKRLLDPERPHMAGLQTTVEGAAKQWYSANLVLLEDREHLKSSILVRYEELVAAPESAFRKICDFLGCDFEGLDLPALEKDLNVQQIARLTVKEIEMIQRTAGSLLNGLGYDFNVDLNQASQIGEAKFESSTYSAFNG